jgi:hypothetical protein
MICMGSSVLSRFAEAEALDNGDPGARFQTLPRTSLRCGRGDTQPQVAIPASAASPHAALPRVAVMAHDAGNHPRGRILTAVQRCCAVRPIRSIATDGLTTSTATATRADVVMRRRPTPIHKIRLRADAQRAGARCARLPDGTSPNLPAGFGSPASLWGAAQ